MYQQPQQPRMAGNGAAAQFQQPQTPNQATSVNAQFPAGYNNQVSNYPQQQQWNNGAGASGYSGQPANNFVGYNNPDFAQMQQQNHQQNWPSNGWSNPGSWNNNPATSAVNDLQKPNNTSGQPGPPCDNYQRTFDYVQQCQNWTAQ